MNLRERKVLDFGGDLLGSQTEVVPAGNTPGRDAGTGDAGPALADFWRLSISVPISTTVDIFSAPFC